MADLDGIHRCTLGTSAFQLRDFRWREQPVVRGGGLVGHKVAVEGSGWVEAASPEDLTTILADVAASFRTTGQDFEVFGVGGASLVQLPAAVCTGGGPYAGFDLLEGMTGPALTRSFRFTLAAERIAGTATLPEVDVPAERRLSTRPDGLLEIVWAGELLGADLEGRFTRLLAHFRRTYPGRRWVEQHEFEQNAAGDAARYLIAGTQTAADLPGPDGDGGLPMVREGDAVLRWDRDEQMRLTRVWDYDLLVVGDTSAVRDDIRRRVTELIGAGGVILRETVTTAFVREQRMRLSFETLAGGNGNPLMNWTQTFRFSEPWPTIELESNVGPVPVVLQRARPPFGRMVQTGLAVGAGAFIQPPPPLFPDKLLEQPETSYTY